MAMRGAHDCVGAGFSRRGNDLVGGITDPQFIRDWNLHAAAHLGGHAQEPVFGHHPHPFIPSQIRNGERRFGRHVREDRDMHAYEVQVAQRLDSQRGGVRNGGIGLCRTVEGGR